MMAGESHPRLVREELDRILASSGFARNARMSQFLRFLVERHIVGRDDELKESVIGSEVFGRRPDYDPKHDSIVRTEAARLRSRLVEYYSREGSANPLLIEVPKGGYVPVVRERQSSSFERAVVDGPPAEASVAAVGRHRFARRWFAIAVPLVALLVVGSWWLVRAERRPIRIAVLPLENLNPGANEDYFADGLTDEIIRQLSVIDGLVVRSRTSSFALKGQPRNVRQFGDQLAADYLVEGSVLRAADQLRINAQVVRVEDDRAIWSGRYDRKLTDVFAIQDEIALGIVNNLRLQLGRGRRRYETSVDAYDSYLKARELLYDRRHPGGVGDHGELDRAITKDPSFAPAYAALASFYALRSAQFPVDHDSEELTRMRTAAERAIALDPLLAEAHAALAMSYARDSEWDRAEKSFKDSIRLDPNESQTRMNYAMWLLTVVGRNDEALEQLQIAEAVDPLSSAVHQDVAWMLMNFGRFTEAERHCEKVDDSNSLKPQCFGRVQLGLGNIDRALTIFSRDPTGARNPQSRGFLGYAYGRAGRRDEAERMAADSRFPNEQALIYAGLGDKDRTFDALQRMTSVGAQRAGRYLSYPEFALLRDDPRLNAFRKNAGLP